MGDPAIPGPLPLGDIYGTPVDINGDFLFVGAPHADVGGVSETGAVYVYKKVGNDQWVQTQILSFGGFLNLESATPSGIRSYGDWLFVPLIGTPVGNTNPANLDLIGSLIIYTLNDNGLWQLHQILNNSTPGLTLLDPSALFGLTFDVDSKNNLLLVGAEYQNGFDTEANVLTSTGVVYAFNLVDNQWLFTQAIFSPIGEFAEETFGGQIAIHDNVALISNSTNIGYPREIFPTNSGNGSVYVYHYDEVKWSFVERVQGDQAGGTLFGSPPVNVSDNFGASLFLNDDWALIGATGETKTAGTPPFNGALYFFKITNKHGKPHLVRKQKFFSDNPASQAFTLFDLAIQGNTAFASDPLCTGPQGVYQGGVVTYNRRHGVWYQDKTIFDPNGAPFSFFGAGLDIQKDLLLIGTSGAIWEQFAPFTVPPIPPFTSLPGKAVLFKLVP